MVFAASFFLQFDMSMRTIQSRERTGGDKVECELTIVHVVESFGGGVFSFLCHLINGLSDYRHVVIYGTQRKEFPSNFETFFPRNVQFIPWEYAQREVSPLQDFRALVRLVQILRKLQPVQKMHLHSSKAGFLGRMAARLLGFSNRVLYTPHGAAFLREDISGRKKQFYILLERFADRLAGDVICCSESECRAFKEIGIQDARFVNNSCPPLQVHASHQDKGKQILIVSSGRMTYQKNPGLFQSIVEHFVGWKDVRFLWIGGGEHGAGFDAENISQTGWIGPAEVAEYMASADIYVSTSRWEGLPISVLEAMSIGLPLLLSDCVGNCDCVKGNGFLFQSLEEATTQLEAMILNEGLRKEQGKASKALFEERFSMRNLLDSYRKLYKSG